LYILTFGLALVGIYLAHKFEDFLKISVTSFLGSYLFVRGISMFAGGFTSEFELYQQVKNGTAHLSTAEFGYFAGIIAFWILGIYYQEHNEQPKNKGDDFNRVNDN